MVEITAEKLSTSDGYRDLRVKDRGCYFEDELRLQLFSEYTSDNCWIECLLNLTRKVLSLYDVRLSSGFLTPLSTVQGDHGGLSLPFVDIITKVPSL